MSNLLVRKLENFGRLTADDRQAIEGCPKIIQRFSSHEDIVSEGDNPRLVNVVIEGWACRYKQLEDGRRQIVALFLPGDMCDPYVFLLDRMSHSLGSLTPLIVSRIPQTAIANLIGSSPTLARAFEIDMLVSAEIQREWTVSLGRRTASERLAHLFCEIALRLKAVGLSNGQSFEIPVTQHDLADMLGLSTVHINRTLQDLRGRGLIEFRARHLLMQDEPGLQDFAMFDPTYLHHQRDTRDL